MSPKKKIIKKTIKSISINDTDHPLRRVAIEMIKNIIEPLLQRGINPKIFFELENHLTNVMQKRLKKYLKTPILADTSETNTKTLRKTTNENDDEDNDGCDCGDCYEDDCGCDCHEEDNSFDPY
jgi:hypothetical protein